VLLLVDNYDSFTYNLYDYFVRAGAEVEVLRNDEIDVSTIAQNYAGVIFSPGPGKPKDAGVMMEILSMYANDLPIFGVCLGMQAIGEHYGAILKKASYPMHGKVSELKCQNHQMFEGLDEPISVCRYHSLVLELSDNQHLEPVAYTTDGEVMAVAHIQLPIWGVQFHPEAILTPQGLTLIDNWLSCFSLRKQ